ncbi:MAG: LD-carboxypeptidase [Paludibacteraceae bacterium]|nr:LD-carboxypeptidase [Paludibacteraceae bacterium]
MIRPPYLKVGDKVAIVSPAGAVSPDLIDGAAETLRSWGFVPVLGNSSKGRNGRFSGSDEERAADLQWALDDPSIRAILCGRGGYGTVRIIDRLDFSSFERNPKWVIGFSDITILHAALANRGFQSVHGVMARALAHTAGNWDAVSALRRCLQGDLLSYQMPSSPLNRDGVAKGTLVGGNLSILYGLRATPYDISPKGKILFIEDISERPYHIDRMMHNLKLSGVLSQISGLLVGEFTDIEEDASFGMTVNEIVADAVSEYGYPVAFNFPVGHGTTNQPVFHGAEVQLTVADGVARLDYLGDF